MLSLTPCGCPAAAEGGVRPVGGARRCMLPPAATINSSACRCTMPAAGGKDDKISELRQLSHESLDIPSWRGHARQSKGVTLQEIGSLRLGSLCLGSLYLGRTCPPALALRGHAAKPNRRPLRRAGCACSLACSTLLGPPSSTVPSPCNEKEQGVSSMRKCQVAS